MNSAVKKIELALILKSNYPCFVKNVYTNVTLRKTDKLKNPLSPMPKK